MLSIDVPILLALSDISIIAMFAISAAFPVSPPSDCNRLALNPVTDSIYALADKPDVLYASLAYPLTISALPLNNVSIPPSDCWSAAPSFNEEAKVSLRTFPIPIAAIILVTVPAKLFIKPCPALSPAPTTSVSIAFSIIPLIPSADGII